MNKTFIETKRINLNEGIKTETTGPFGSRGKFYLESRLHNFKEKIEGKTYVDGEYKTDWVQYK